jgi:hypothetical protein
VACERIAKSNEEGEMSTATLTDLGVGIRVEPNETIDEIC